MGADPADLGRQPVGRAARHAGVWIGDASAFPTASGRTRC